MDELNKTQIILLVLLVSFVTSIATGITTVTLLDQAPPGVTHTISKVIERTVERVIPEKLQINPPREEKKEESFASVVERSAGVLVRIYSPGVEEKEGAFVGLGTIDGKGVIATDSALVSDNVLYTIRLADASTREAKTIMQDETGGLALLLISDTKDVPEKTWGDSNAVRLGDGIFALYGEGDLSLGDGVITKIEIQEETATTQQATSSAATKKTFRAAFYSNAFFPRAASGTALFGTSGMVIGMVIVREGASFTLPTKFIEEVIAKTLAAKDAKATPTTTEN